MKSYLVTGDIVLSFLEGNEQKDYLIDQGAVETDGHTIWWVSAGVRYESITTADAVDLYVSSGNLKELKSGDTAEAFCNEK